MDSKQENEHSWKSSNFDLIFAGLLSMRLRVICQENPELQLRFQMKNNFARTEPFCDMSVHLQWRDIGGVTRMTYFVYLLNSECKLQHVSNLYRRIYLFIKDSSVNKTEREGHYLVRDSRFIIIFFRDIFENEICQYFSNTSEIEFPFADVLHSGVGKMFFFSKQGKKMFNMYDGIERHDFHRMFILRLSIISCQTSTEELCSLLEDCTVRTLGPSFPYAEKVVEHLLKILRRKWHETDGCPFSDCTSELYEAIAELILLDENNDPLMFEDVCCDRIKSLISNFQAIYISVPGISRDIRCSKVLQVLKSLSKQYPEQSTKYVTLSESTFEQYPLPILEYLCKTYCDVLVLNIDQISTQILSFLSRILQNVRKIVILSQQFIPKIQTLVSRLKRKKYAEFIDKWTVSQIAEFVQKLLVRRKVIFQGRETSLQELEESWPSMKNNISGATLNRLHEGETVSFGYADEAISFDKSYISRKIKHETVLKNEIFRLSSAFDYFLLTGFPEELIENLRQSKEFWVECRLLEPENLEVVPPPQKKKESKHEKELTENDRKTRWSIWKSNKEPQMVQTANNRNIHWLLYKSQLVIWKSTFGNSSVIEQFVDKPTSSCQVNNFCVHCDYELLNWKKQIALISGESGMGKTTLLRRISLLFKEIRPLHWVVFLPISRQKLLRNLPRCVGINEVVCLLELCVREEDSKENCVTRYFIKDCLENSGRIIILVDGIDELDPEETEIAFCVLKVLSETRATKLFVTARTFAAENISKALNCEKLILLPFSGKDQHCYVLSNMAKDVSRNETKSFKKRVEHMLDTFRNATGNNNNLCSVPLYLRFLLEVYKTEEFQTRLHNSNFSKTSINILFLYTIYMLRTYKCCNNKRNSQNPSLNNDPIEEQLEKYAVTIFSKFTKQKLGLKTTEGTLTDLIKICELDKARLIVQNYQGRPEFTHHTFKEYLVSLWCKKNYKSKPNVVKNIIKYNNEAVRYFLDAMLCEEKPLHQHVLNGEVEMLATALQAGCAVNDRDDGGRTALHLAASNGCNNAILLLLKAEGEVSLLDDVMHWTPLRYADQFLHLEAADLLLGAGSNHKDIQNIRTQFLSGTIEVSELIEKDLAHLLKALIPYNSRRFPYLRQNVPKMLKNMSEIALVSGSINVSKMLMNWQRDINETINGVSPLHLSAFSGNYELTQMLLFNGAAVGEFDVFGETPLHKAVRCGHISICKALLKFGADPDVPDASGKTPIFLALQKNRSKDMIELLLQHNAKLDTKTSHGSTILLAACRDGNEEVCKYLIQKGSDTNTCDLEGTAPLHVASEKGFYEICSLLLQNGANVNFQDVTGESSLHRLLKTEHCSPKICQLLLGCGADVNLKDKWGVTPFLLSIKKKKICILPMILENKPDFKFTDSENRTILHEAVLSRSEFLSSLLETVEIDINCKDIHGNTPLYLSSKLGYEEICLLLLQKNADVIFRNNCGRSVLHAAAAGGYLWICRLLLENGAILNIQDSIGKTPLHYASSGGHESVCRLLLEQGANPNAQDIHKKTPLFSAVQGNEVVCRMLLDFGADATTRDINGKTLMHYAARHGQDSICNLLLMQRVDVNACDVNKRSVLRVAVSNNQRSVCMFLLHRGADVNLKDTEETTVLMIAAKANNEELCRLLLENGANVNDKDCNDQTAIDIAASKGHKNVCRLLVEYGSVVNELHNKKLTSPIRVVSSEICKDLNFPGGGVRKLGVKRRRLIHHLWCCSL